MHHAGQHLVDDAVIRGELAGKCRGGLWLYGRLEPALGSSVVHPDRRHLVDHPVSDF
jgi:hypothetical protein